MKSTDWCEMSWKKAYSSLLPSPCVPFIHCLQERGLRMQSWSYMTRGKGLLITVVIHSPGEVSVASEFKTVNAGDF